MKRFLLLLLPLSLLTLSCQTDEDALALEASTEEFEVETIGVGGDCRLPQIDFIDKLDEVQKITNSPWSIHYAYGLSPELREGKVLLVRIRKYVGEDSRICYTLGPSYSAVQIVSAKVKEECLTYRQAPTISVEGPSTGRVDEAVPLTVSFGAINGCGQFSRFIETGSGTTRTVHVQARYAGCICTQVAPTLQTTYTFKAAQPGVYEIKFWKADNSFLTHTITVQ